MPETDFNQLIYLIITNEVDKKHAYRIANLLLEDKLVPCVSFKNIQSNFWWGGEINQSDEVQLIIKCKEQNINKVCEKISKHHSYQVPEIVYFPVSTSQDYHGWVNSF